MTSFQASPISPPSSQLRRRGLSCLDVGPPNRRAKSPGDVIVDGVLDSSEVVFEWSEVVLS